MTSRPRIAVAGPLAPDASTLAARPTRNARDTRARILAAARVRFAAEAYENVGTRDIAADAGVDAALVNRYFGGKDKLFDEVITGAFRLEPHFADALTTFGDRITARVMSDGIELDPGKVDALALLLRSAGSPATAARVSARFHAEFVQPLAGLLRGRDAELRAALIASYLVGLATMKHALGSPVLGPAAKRKAVARVGAAIQACVNG